MRPDTETRVILKRGWSVDWWVLVVLILPFLGYLPALIGGVPFPPGSSLFSDLMISHYPYLLYLQKSLITYHQIPLWYSAIYAGTPLAANPLSGLFYIPGWAAMIFPLPWGILLVAAGHSVFGAGGMYLLLRRLEVSKRSSLVGALSFGMMPKLAAHLGAGHISLLYALAWTPWLLAVSLKDWKGWKTGIVAGMLFLADPRWAAYAGLLFITFAIAYRRYSAQRKFLFYLKAGSMALLVSAPLIVPLIEYIPLSTRSAMGAVDVYRYGLPASQLLGIFLPVSSGNVEWFLYAGGCVTVLAILQIFLKDLWKKTRFWNFAILISLLLGMAFWGNALSWTAKIPVLSLLRVPARALFITGFSLAVLSALVLDFLSTREGSKTIIRLVGLSLLAFAILFGVGIELAAGRIGFQVLWGLGSLALASLILLFYSKLEFGMFYLVLCVLLAGDLVGADWMAYQVRTDYSRITPEVLSYLERDQSEFRIYSPSYSVAQDEAVANSLEMVDGVDPMQVSSYAKYMEKATGVTRSGYSVSIPEFATGDPDSDNADSQPNAEMLGLLNVKYLISEFPLEGEGIVPIELDSPQYLYLNQSYFPRTWIEDSTESGEIREASLVKVEPDRIEIEAEGPGDLVLSEIYYPGWKVLVDGQKAEISSVYQVLRLVPLSEGKHFVEYVYRPFSVIVGLALAGIGWLLAIFLTVRKEI